MIGLEGIPLPSRSAVSPPAADWPPGQQVPLLLGRHQSPKAYSINYFYLLSLGWLPSATCVLGENMGYFSAGPTVLPLLMLLVPVVASDKKSSQLPTAGIGLSMWFFLWGDYKIINVTGCSLGDERS